MLYQKLCLLDYEIPWKFIYTISSIFDVEANDLQLHSTRKVYKLRYCRAIYYLRTISIDDIGDGVRQFSAKCLFVYFVRLHKMERVMRALQNPLEVLNNTPPQSNKMTTKRNRKKLLLLPTSNFLQTPRVFFSKNARKSSVLIL